MSTKFCTTGNAGQFLACTWMNLIGYVKIFRVTNSTRKQKSDYYDYHCKPLQDYFIKAKAKSNNYWLQAMTSYQHVALDMHKVDIQVHKVLSRIVCPTEMTAKCILFHEVCSYLHVNRSNSTTEVGLLGTLWRTIMRFLADIGHCGTQKIQGFIMFRQTTLDYNSGNTSAYQITCLCANKRRCQHFREDMVRDSEF